MTFLLDHCIWRETENILRKAKFDCITLRELGKAEASNGEVISLAKSKKAILLTRDSDFSNLSLYSPGTHGGIIFLRISPETISQVHDTLMKALRSTSSEELSGNLLIVTNTTYRLHKTK